MGGSEWRVEREEINHNQIESQTVSQWLSTERETKTHLYYVAEMVRLPCIYSKCVKLQIVLDELIKSFVFGTNSLNNYLIHCKVPLRL